MADLIKNKYIQAGFAGVLIIVLYGGYNIINKIIDNSYQFEQHLLEQQAECTKINSKLAEALDKLGDVLNK